MADPVWTTGYCEYDLGVEGAPPGSVKVTTLHWNAALNDQGFEASQYGTVNTADQNRVFPLPALENVPESVMTGWVQQALGQDEVDRIDADLQANIDAQVTPNTGGFIP